MDRTALAFVNTIAEMLPVFFLMLLAVEYEVDGSVFLNALAPYLIGFNLVGMIALDVIGTHHIFGIELCHNITSY